MTGKKKGGTARKEPRGAKAKGGREQKGDRTKRIREGEKNDKK